MHRPRTLALSLVAALCAFCSAQSRSSTAAGAAADWEQGLWPACDGLLLPDIATEARGLWESDEDAPPSTERVTRVEVRLEHGSGYGLSVAHDVPWRGLELPRDSGFGEGSVLRLRLRSDAGRVLLSADRQPASITDLAQLLEAGPGQVIVDPGADVPMGFVVSLLARLLESGVHPTLARLEQPLDRAPGELEKLLDTVLIAECARAAQGGDELPLLGVRLRADARAPWNAAAVLLEACVRNRVYRLTFSIKAGDLELDLAPRGGTTTGLVQTPVVTLETEIELIDGPPRGVDLDNFSNKNLDSTSVEDAFGIGSGWAGPFGERMERNRLSDEGGSAETEAAVEAALDWLQRHQQSEAENAGAWRAHDWPELCTDCESCAGPSFAEEGHVGPGRGEARYDVGVSALALLAFLGRGNSQKNGNYKLTVERGLRWLRSQQDADGAVGWDAEDSETIYNHALATLALCDAYALSNDFRLRPAAERAVAFCLKAQNPGLGWKYGIKPGKSDSSLTGWMLLALKTARLAGLEVPDEAIEAGRSWLERATGEDGATGYESAGSGSAYMPALEEQIAGKMYRELPVMTAVGLACRLSLGAKRSEEVLRLGKDLLLQELPAWDGRDYQGVSFYYWYYGTLAMFQWGGEDWQTWNQALQQALLPTQRPGGSWDPLGEWAFVGGRVYSTALNALSLETYYRQDRVSD